MFSFLRIKYLWVLGELQYDGILFAGWKKIIQQQSILKKNYCDVSISSRETDGYSSLTIKVSRTAATINFRYA